MNFFVLVFSGDTCTATAKYDCTVGINTLLTWEVTDGERQLYSPSFHRFQEFGTNYSLTEIADITIYAELRDLNSTKLFSVLFIMFNISISFSNVIVQCDSIIKDSYQRGKTRLVLHKNS